MFEYVRDAGISPASALVNRKMTNLILLHMSGSDVDTVAGMDRYHKSKGHKMIDYNFVVYADGSVWNGRGLHASGGSVNNSNSATKGMNDRSVAICCVGDFNKHSVPKTQLDALKMLVRDVASYYKLEDVSQIRSHKEAAGSGYTSCPGTQFPTDEVREFALREAETIDDEKPVIGAIEAEAKAKRVWSVKLRCKPVRDNVAIRQVEFVVYMEGKENDAMAKQIVVAKQNAGNPALFSKEIQMDTPGKYVARARAFDATGNRSDFKGFAKFALK